MVHKEPKELTTFFVGRPVYFYIDLVGKIVYIIIHHSLLIIHFILHMSSQNCSSDFDIWVVKFYEFGEFVDRGSGSRNVVDDEDGFVAE